jgi:signal transduction histidine kinase
MDSLAAAVHARPVAYLRSPWSWRALGWCAQAAAAGGCVYGLGCAVVVPLASGAWRFTTPAGAALTALMAAVFTVGAVLVGAWQRSAVRLVGFPPVASRYALARHDPEPTAAGPGMRQRAGTVARAVAADLAFAVLLLPLGAVAAVAALLGWWLPAFTVVALIVSFVHPDAVVTGVGWSVVIGVGCVVLTVVLPWVWGWTALTTVRLCGRLGDPRGDAAHRQAAARQAVSVRLSDAFSAERRRIERNLHDGAQQRIVAQSLTLGRAAVALQGDEREAALRLVQQATAENRAILADLRSLVRSVSPRVLTDRGLPAAVDEVAARAGLDTEVEIDLPRRPPDLVEQTAYFVILEALTNTAKHAAATQARVQVSRRADALRVRVRDDGCGGAVVRDDGGLAGLIDRVRSIGGTMDLSSPAGGPTTVLADIPLVLPRTARAQVARWDR